MPHVSKYSLDHKIKNDLDIHILAFLDQTGSGTRKNIFGELFTKTERIMIGKRLILLLFIERGVPTHTIATTLKMSSSTVARFQLLVSRGAYHHTRKWLSSKNMEEKILNNIMELFSIPFKAQRKSLSRLIDEM